MSRTIRTSKVLGGALAFSALALSSSFFYRVSGEALGPGAFMLSIPKILAASVAPFIGVAGASGAALGILGGILERGRYAKALRKPTARGVVGLVLGAPLIVIAGLTAAGLSTSYVQRVTMPHGDFARAFGADWQQQIPAEPRDGMLARRWTWKLPSSPEPRVERDVAYWTIPGTDRRLLADVWQPPAGVKPSGLAFVYVHGGGYVSQDKGGPTEPWFRHLAAQGHVVMDISYRLIPETNVPGMQGDVKRAIVWLKRNAGRLGVNPERIVLGGGSAGSHLALLAAYAPDHPRLTPDDVRGEDLSVRGVIGYYNAGDNRLESKVAVERGPIAAAAREMLTGLIESWSGSKIPADDEWSRQFLGGEPSEWPEMYRQVSPITHVGPNTPPTLQIAGEHDVYVSEAQAGPALHRRLQEAGAPSVYVELPRTDHAFDMFFPEISPAAQSALYDVDRFLALMASPLDWPTSDVAKN